MQPASRVLKHKTLHPVKLLSRRRVRNNADEDYGERLKTIVARIHDESHSPRFPKVLLIIYARRNLSIFLEALMIHSHLDSYLVSKITISIDTAIFICIE